jgi:hypothetical protein
LGFFLRRLGLDVVIILDVLGAVGATKPSSSPSSSSSSSLLLCTPGADLDTVESSLATRSSVSVNGVSLNSDCHAAASVSSTRSSMAPDAWAGMPGKNEGYQISMNQQTFCIDTLMIAVELRSG